MVGSLQGPVTSVQLLRFPLGIAQRELGRTFRHLERSAGAAGATTVIPMVLGVLNTIPLPIADMTGVGAMAVWPELDAFEDFLHGAPLVRHWQETASESWSLVSQPLKSHGTWRGNDPFPMGVADERPQGPLLVLTYGRLRTRRVGTFWRNNPTAVRHLRRQPGSVWAQGWLSSPLDAGTLSLWRSLGDSTKFAYGAGGHQPQIRAMREEGWTSENWFARFRPVTSQGTWGGVDPLRSALTAAASTDLLVGAAT